MCVSYDYLIYKYEYTMSVKVFVINKGCRGPSYLCSQDEPWNLFNSNFYLFYFFVKN